MARGNVEAVYRAERAFNEGDVEALVSLLHPDIEWETGLLGTPTYRGHDGVRRMFRDVQAAWADLHMEIVGDPLERDDAVLLEAHLEAHGRSTGAPVEATQFWVEEFRDGLCIRHRAFLTKSDALAAVGLSG
jgi:ketosteroid isomerase-like protein